jgi:hypothetical protein
LNSTSAFTTFELPVACAVAFGICDGRTWRNASWQLTVGAIRENRDMKYSFNSVVAA